MKISAGSISTAEAIPIIQEQAASDKDFDRIVQDLIRDKKEQELKEACQELEAVFLNKVMDAMRATIVHSDLVKRGFATDVWESMLYEQYSKDISKTGSIGLAQMLYKQLSANL